MSGGHPLMTPAEVAALLRVDVTTVARWRKAGKLTAVPTPGIRAVRYYTAEIEALLRGEQQLTPEQIEALHQSILGGES